MHTVSIWGVGLWFAAPNALPPTTMATEQATISTPSSPSQPPLTPTSMPTPTAQPRIQVVVLMPAIKKSVESARRRPGRPKGAKNNASRAERVANSQHHTSREGKHFRHKEAMQLAEGWVLQSLKAPNQKEEGMWEQISDYLEKQHGTKRSTNSLRSKWSSLAHDVHIYLAARNHVLHNPPTAHTQKHLDTTIMKLYCSTNKRDDSSGVHYPASPLKYLAITDFLLKYPKFFSLAEGMRSETDLGRKRAAPVVLDSDEDDGGRASAPRSRGIKDTKRDDERRKSDNRMADRLYDISTGLKRSSAALKVIAASQ